MTKFGGISEFGMEEFPPEIAFAIKSHIEDSLALVVGVYPSCGGGDELLQLGFPVESLIVSRHWWMYRCYRTLLCLIKMRDGLVVVQGLSVAWNRYQYGVFLGRGLGWSCGDIGVFDLTDPESLDGILNCVLWEWRREIRWYMWGWFLIVLTAMVAIFIGCVYGAAVVLIGCVYGAALTGRFG